MHRITWKYKRFLHQLGLKMAILVSYPKKIYGNREVFSKSEEVSDEKENIISIWKRKTIFPISAIRIANFSLAMKMQTRNILTACSATALCMHWGESAAETSSISPVASKIAAHALCPTASRGMLMSPEITIKS